MKRSINQQLQIGLPNRDVNIVNRYARGLKSIQPQLMNEDPDLDYYNDTQSIDAALYGVSPYRDVNLGTDWFDTSGDRDISEEMYEATEDYSEAAGAGVIFVACNQSCNLAHILNKSKRKKCKLKCSEKFSVRVRTGKLGGINNYIDEQKALKEAAAAQEKLRAKTATADAAATAAAEGSEAENSSGLKNAAIGVGIVAILGVVGYMLFANKK
jgi:hypothetical protein|tara:strand:- start:11582 stop:12220 length:639 start_codon:yes stop_codon:yes gene_type:complete